MSPRQGLVRGTLTYLRRDLREIITPTSLPDDDDERFTASGVSGDDDDSRRRQHQHRNRLGGRLRAVAAGIQDYCDTWKKIPEPSSTDSEEHSTDNNKTRRLFELEDGLEDDAAAASRSSRLVEAEPDAADAGADAAAAAAARRDLAAASDDARDALASASRAGAEALRPALRQLYRTRAAAYRDAVFSFVEGYREGLAGGRGRSEIKEGEGEGDDDDDDMKGKRKKNET